MGGGGGKDERKMDTRDMAVGSMRVEEFWRKAEWRSSPIHSLWVIAVWELVKVCASEIT